MRRLVLLPVLALLTAGCGFQDLLFQPVRQEALTSEIKGLVPTWVKQESLPAEAVPGAKLFAVAGCTACHTYLGAGGANLGAPDLSTEGLKNRGIDFQIRHLKCPSCVNAGSPMPPFASLGDVRLRDLAIFLEASKGTP